MNNRNKELEYLAYHDLLTGLLNRNWFFRHKHLLIEKNLVYFMDINDLKKVNDKGHTEGDKHIIKCVNSINVMKDDYFIRYAGDEFVLFSDNLYEIDKKLFCSAVAEIQDDVDKAVNIADKRMMKFKRISE